MTVYLDFLLEGFQACFSHARKIPDTNNFRQFCWGREEGAVLLCPIFPTKTLGYEAVQCC